MNKFFRGIGKTGDEKLDRLQALLVRAFDQIRMEGASGLVSPLTTKGDIWTFDTDDARLPVGSDGQVLVADAAEPTGLKWDAISTSGGVGWQQRTIREAVAALAGSDNPLDGDEASIFEDDFYFHGYKFDNAVETNSNGRWHNMSTLEAYAAILPIGTGAVFNGGVVGVFSNNTGGVGDLRSAAPVADPSKELYFYSRFQFRNALPSTSGSRLWLGTRGGNFDFQFGYRKNVSATNWALDIYGETLDLGVAITLAATHEVRLWTTLDGGDMTAHVIIDDEDEQTIDISSPPTSDIQRGYINNHANGASGDPRIYVDRIAYVTAPSDFGISV